MRVLIVTSLYPSPGRPGRAPFNRQQFAALSLAHEVEVIAPVPWMREQPVAGRLAEGVVVHHPRFVYPPGVMRRWHGALYARSVRACFADAAERFRPHVVLGCWAYPDGWAAVRLARGAGVPVALKVHGSDLLTIDEHSFKRGPTVEALRGADAVIAVSEHLRERAVSLGADPARTRTVYNGIDGDLFRPGSREEARRRLGLAVGSGERLVLAIGNLAQVKGFDVLIDAAAVLRAGGRSLRAVIVGEGPARPTLEQRIAGAGLAGIVRLVGGRPHTEMADWYRASDVFVLPSRSEGVPNVLLEAMACGIPCVATRVGGVPEVLGEESLVRPEDPAALARAIGASLEDRVRGTGVAFKPGDWDSSARALAGVLVEVARSDADTRARAG